MVNVDLNFKIVFVGLVFKRDFDALNILTSQFIFSLFVSAFIKLSKLAIKGEEVF